MKILFDGYSLEDKEIYGIQRYALEILYEIDKLIQPNEVEVVIPYTDSSQRIIDKYNYKNIRVVELKYRRNKRKYIDGIYWSERVFPRYAKTVDGIFVDLLLNFPNIKADIITIYDCIPELFPHIKPSLKYRLHILKTKYKQKRGIRNCKFILTISDCSRNDIKKVYNTYDKPIEIIPCGWQHFDRINEDGTILERLQIKKGDFFFSLGSRLYHKNAKWIIAAAKNNPQYTFVISGSSYAGVDKDASDNKEKNVIFAGYLSDSEVKTLMKNCKAFIQPSLYEGFGIPPIEAMSVGADCIVSNVASLPEIYKDSVWYIDPYDYEGIKIDEIMLEKKESNERILDEYSWEKSAIKLLEIINKIDNNRL